MSFLRGVQGLLGTHNMIVSRSFIKPQKPSQPVGTDDNMIHIESLTRWN